MERAKRQEADADLERDGRKGGRIDGADIASFGRIHNIPKVS